MGAPIFDKPLFENLVKETNHIIFLTDNVGKNDWLAVDIDNAASPLACARPAKFHTMYKEKSFVYSLNSLNFRCMEFEDVDFTKPIFMVAGCSMTFGTGLPIEHTWGHIIYERLKAEFPGTQFLNIAMGGSSIDFSVRAMSCLGDMKYYVDCLVNMMPDITRREFSTESNLIAPFMHTFNVNDRIGVKETRAYMEEYARTFGIDDYNNKYNFNKNLLIMDLMARTYNFPLLLDSWAEYDSDSIEPFYTDYFAEPQFKKYFMNTKYFFRPAENPQIINGVSEDKWMGRDGVHPGLYHHKRYADEIYDSVREQFIKSIIMKKKVCI